MCIYMITHKEFSQPRLKGYKSILVGAYRGHIFGDVFDDEGENISVKNENYCELTGLYWLWRHCSDDYIGICHYRRWFSNSFRKLPVRASFVESKLKRYDIILPFVHKLPITVKEQYCRNSGFENDLEKTRDVIKNICPDYLSDFDRVMERKKIYFFNMLIMGKEKYQQYCSWLFSILFEVERVVDIGQYNTYQRRIYGFLAERLLNVWVLHNHLKIYETGVINTEERWSLEKSIFTGLKRKFYCFAPRIWGNGQK